MKNTDKTLYVAKEMPQNATILILDLQTKYFEEALSCQDSESQIFLKKRINGRLDVMKNRLEQLKEEGHTMVTSVDEDGIYPGFEHIPDKTIPCWFDGYDFEEVDDDYSSRLNEEFLRELEAEETVLVCGLWMELCQKVVVLNLRRMGVNAFLSIDPALSLENKIVWVDEDVITLEESCQETGVIIKHM